MMDNTKMKRQVRRHDHIAKDLRTPKYRPRVIPDKTKEIDRHQRWKDQILDWDDLIYNPYDKDYN